MSKLEINEKEERGVGSTSGPSIKPEIIVNEDGALVLLYRNWFGEEEADELFKETRLLATEQYPIVIFGKSILQPRFNFLCGDKERDKTGVSKIGTAYKYKMPFNEWVPSLENLRDRLNGEFNVRPNACLLNRYLDGNFYIGAHSDREVVDVNASVFTLSLGATRRFLLHRKSDKKVTETYLNNRDLVLMSGTCQKLYKHSIPKELRVKEERISVTYRVT